MNVPRTITAAEHAAALKPLLDLLGVGDHPVLHDDFVVTADEITFTVDPNDSARATYTVEVSG